MNYGNCCLVCVLEVSRMLTENQKKKRNGRCTHEHTRGVFVQEAGVGTGMQSSIRMTVMFKICSNV